jgi:flagellar biosynthetic protein FliR
LILAFVAHGGSKLAPEAVDSYQKVFIALPFELILGIAMGFVVVLAMASIQMAADAIAPMVGLGAAQLFDPQTQTQTTPIGEILRLMALLVAILGGFHRVVIGSLIESFRVIPPGTFLDPSLSTPVFLTLSGEALILCLRMALPVIATLLMVQVAMAFISRAAPAMQIFSVGFAVSLVVGLGVLFMAFPEMMQEMMVDISQVGNRIELVISSMAPR